MKPLRAFAVLGIVSSLAAFAQSAKPDAKPSTTDTGKAGIRLSKEQPRLPQKTTMTVVRTSTLRIPPDQLEAAAAAMKSAEAELTGIRRLKGLKAYFAGVDREKSQLVNVSVWETAEDAKQMHTFTPMLALANKLLAYPGVTFVRPIPNFEVLWPWGDASGGGLL